MKALRDRSALFLVLTTAALSASIAVPSLAQTNTPAIGERVQPANTRAGTLRTLGTLVTLDAREARLHDVLAYLESVTLIRFEPVWLDQERAGLDPDKLVSLDVEARPLLEVLERLLEHVGDEFDSAAWQIGEDGRVQIGPKSRLNERTTIVIYDLNDVLFEVPDFDTVPSIDIQAASQQGQGSSQTPLQNQGETEPLKASMRSTDEIVDLITTFVEPEQWRRNGGEGALMRVWNNQLIVRAPRYVLRGIAGLL